MGPLYVRKTLPYRTIQGYTVVLSDRDQMFLNQTGTAIWNQLSTKTGVKPIADALASRFSTGQTSPPQVLSDVENFLETLYQRGLVLKDGADNPRSRPEPHGSPEKTDSDQNAPTARPVIRSVQEECMTPDLTKETRSIADHVEKLYWEKSYIYKMHMELTYRCNFKCVQCYNTTHKGAEKEMSLPEWESVLQQLADMGCYLLTFTGGEVFVRKDAVEILQIACDKGFSFRISTNGSLVDEKLISRLLPMRNFLQGVDVSFYGADSQSHDTLSCKKGAHEKTLRAVTLLAESGLGLLAKFITMRDNFEGISEFERMMRSMGIKYAVSTESLIPRTDGNTSPLIQILTDQQYERLVSTQNVGIGSGRSQACKPGHIRGAITPDGNVSPCEWLTDFKLGNLREKSLQEIWYGDQFLSFRKVFQQESECPSCSLKPGCRRCPAHSYLETGNLLSCAPIQRHNAEIFQSTYSGMS
jgi:radical SAM protein with 4Fe4S-binding SPASM domain